MANEKTTTVDDTTAVREVPERIMAAWAGNDAAAFAEVFTDDASLILPGDVYLTSRDQIRSFMATAFAGPYRGTRVWGAPVSVRSLADDVVLLITSGGVLAPGEEKVAAEQAIRASWLLAKRDGEWLIAAYQNTPIGTA